MSQSPDKLESSAPVFPPDLAENGFSQAGSSGAEGPTSDVLENPGAQARENPAPEEPAGWRDEVSSRLDRYRARHKPSAPRYPSLLMTTNARQTWNPPRTLSTAAATQITSTVPNQSRPNISRESVARDVNPPMAQSAESPASGHSTLAGALPSASAKILEFPRSWSAAPVSLHELAEPVRNGPRILDVPETEPPQPALGGITIEAQHKELERRPGVDTLLQPSPLGRRILAAFVDGLVVALASTLFAFIFWKIAAIRLEGFQLVALAAGVPSLFWLVYQYLLIVYSASTPGLRVARLELTGFDGSRTTRSLRRWRVLASYLSSASLGMGYAWVFLDEDSLCWHDRITHTQLAPRRARASRKVQ